MGSRVTIDDWQDLLPARLLCASAPAASAAISLRQYRLDDDAVIELPAMAEHTMCFVVGRAAVFEQRDGARWVRRTYRAGEGRIVPAGVSVSARVIGSAVTAHLHMRAAWFDGAAVDEFGIDSKPVRILARPWLQDAFLWLFAAGLLRRTRVDPALDGMIMDAAALGLACYLIRVHSSASDRCRPELSERGRGVVADFIDDEVAAELGLDELAQAIGVAPRALLACFVEADVESLRAHMGHWRIRRALHLLRGSAIPLDAIARDLGFSSRAALDIASQFAVGCTAVELRGFSANGATPEDS
jgi:AraC-like DNA-binding protein